MPLRVPAEARDAVAVVLDRIDAGIVLEAALDQNFQRPQRRLRDRVAWRTIGARLHAAGIGNAQHRAARVVPELLRRHPVDELMRVAVTPNLVAAHKDSPDHRGMPLRHPAQNEERGLHGMPVQQAQDALHLPLDTRRIGVPYRLTRRELHFRGMEVLLDIDGQGIDHANALALRPRIRSSATDKR